MEKNSTFETRVTLIGSIITMKKITVCLLLSALSVGSLSAATILLEGKYQNKNLYVQNGLASSGVGFCVYEVRVNGEVTTDEVNSSAFEIDLRQRNLRQGQDVVIEIYHKDGCAPKVINPDALKPAPTFETVNITVNDKGVVSWQTKGESGSLPYIVEQFKWNKWVAVGEVAGKGTETENKYTFQTKLTSGSNKFRVKQVGLNKKPRYSPEAVVNSKQAPITFQYDKKSSTLTFSGETEYEIYDRFGNLVKKGYGSSADVSSLEKNIHYVSYDSTTSEFNRK